MKYENFNKVKEIVKDIDEYKSLLDSLDASWYLSMSKNSLPKHTYLEIQPGVDGEFVDLATEFCNKIKNKISNKISDLHKQLELL